MIKRTLTIPIYECKVVLIFDKDISAASKRIHQRHKMEWPGHINYAEVIAINETVHLYYILFSTEYLTLNLLVHEITHLGGTILMDRGEETINSEPLAYLNGYLAEAIEKVMVRCNIEFIKPKQYGLLQKKTSSDRSDSIS